MNSPHPVRMSEARKLVEHVKKTSEPQVYRFFLLEQHLGAKLLKYREYRRYTHRKLIDAWDLANMDKESRIKEVADFRDKVEAAAGRHQKPEIVKE